MRDPKKMTRPLLNEDIKEGQNNNASVKSKELQSVTQANSFTAHLILPNRTQSPPVTRQFIDKFADFFKTPLKNSFYIRQ
jgi:hypothetical protein